MTASFKLLWTFSKLSLNFDDKISCLWNMKKYLAHQNNIWCMMLTVFKVISLLMFLVIYMQFYYLKLLLKIKLTFHYVYLITRYVPNTLNENKQTNKRQGFGCLWLLRVPWTARRSSQSILKEISRGCSLEGLMLKLKLQYFGRLMGRVDSWEKTLMLGGVGGRRRRGR